MCSKHHCCKNRKYGISTLKRKEKKMSYKHLGKNYFNYYSVPIKDDVYRDRKNNSTDDDKKKYVVRYRPLIVLLCITFKKVGQRPSLRVIG